MTSTPIHPTLDADRFPASFTWGVATSAHQIEGATDVGGRGPSIWDTFAARPGHTVRGETGAVANDHYRRWADDLDLVRSLGVDAYRFSVAWPRVQPGGRGPANAEGLAFYDRLVDGMLERGIEPWATLYHWDLPDELEQAGGWPHRDTADRFADYTELVVEALGDRVGRWITLNEPWCSAFLGYASGRHAPGRTDPADAVRAAHHLLLGHGRAVDVVRALRPDAQVGVTLNLYPVSPVDDTGRHDDAARRVDGLANRLFLDPVLLGRYPEDVVDDLRPFCDQAHVRPGDLGTISAELDFLGVNYYTRHVVEAGPFPGAADVVFAERDLARTSTGWEVDPDGLVDVLAQVVRDYPPVPIVLTENGAAFDDELEDGKVLDHDRVSFLATHLDALARAREAGAPVEGYFAWSLMDNYEWAEGYDKRFGLVHVDFETQERTVKESGRWYADLVRAHRALTGRSDGQA
ncbi:GH1 family beta-glucosidase [Solicola sp. PLA-1-18]|uniref:GH1 family beta-glucosidase n=1 Tax=Solicola sp. PLA-1-18 TaxID=3380532 RepID=UPI003B762F86